MRAIVMLGILLLGLNSAAREPEYSSLLAEYAHDAGADSLSTLVEIDSSTGKGDRLAVAALQPHKLPVEIIRPGYVDDQVTLASADSEIPTGSLAATDTESDGNRTADVSLDDLCNALFTSAQDNDLPIPFFANLLWQESRLRSDDISKKGAMGIAQFMPQAAVETGLDDPFDPMQAIPASARRLQKLWLQFGNLGFVAAAYNAGAHRVTDWLQHRRSLPRETRDYVVRITGLSVDAWKSMPVDNDALTFVRHMPCRGLPAFASVEQAQLQEAQMTEAKLAQAPVDGPAAGNTPEPAAQIAPKQAAGHKHDRSRELHEAHHATHEHHAAKREAEHAPHAAHEKRRSV
jgi:hypothetical protein